MKIVQEFFDKGKIDKAEYFISTEEYQNLDVNEIIEETENVSEGLAWAVTIFDNGNKEIFSKTNYND